MVCTLSSACLVVVRFHPDDNQSIPSKCWHKDSNLKVSDLKFVTENLLSIYTGANWDVIENASTDMIIGWTTSCRNLVCLKLTLHFEWSQAMVICTRPSFFSQALLHWILSDLRASFHTYIKHCNAVVSVQDHRHLKSEIQKFMNRFAVWFRQWYNLPNIQNPVFKVTIR